MSEKTKILYVDDENINLRLFEFNLRDKYDIYVAESGPGGLKVLEHNPDIKVVVSDMRMPIMNGVEFIAAAKEKFTKISYFILTAFEINDEIQNAIDSGLIQKYFRKPFDVNEIDTEIIKAISYM